MMRKLKLLGASVFVFVLVFCSLCVSVNAELIDYVTEDEEGYITLAGSLENGKNNRIVSVYCVENDVDIETALSGNAEGLLHIGFQKVNFDGSYEYKFFPSGLNNITDITMIVRSSGLDERDIDISYVPPVWISQLITDIKNGNIGERFDDLLENGEYIGVDVKGFTSDRDKTMFIKRVNESKAVIGTNGLKKLKEVVALVVREQTLLNELSDVKYWSGVYDVLDTYKDLMPEMDFDGYEDAVVLDSDNKAEIFSKLLYKDFADADAVTKFFNDVVEEVTKENVDVSTNRGGNGDNRGGGQFIPQAIPNDYKPKDQVSENAIVFNDLSEVAWAEEAIYDLASKEIVNGVGNGRFAPNDYVTREQFAKIISLAFVYKEGATATNFSDVATTEWYYPYVASATENLYMIGVGDSIFGVGNYITRQDMAVTLYRVMKSFGRTMTPSEVEFADGEMISDYAKDAVSYMQGSGFINGKGDGFAPLDFATRAETVVLISRLLK